jgi:hypothetical protein
MNWELSLLIGIAGSVMGAFASVLFQHWRAKRDVLNAVRFKVYMMLLDLNGIHFWIASRDMRKEAPDPDQAHKYFLQAMRIADELRKTDRIPEGKDILEEMFGLQYANENDRANALGKLLEEMGRKVNPNYHKTISEITRRGQALIVDDFDEFTRRSRKIQ